MRYGLLRRPLIESGVGENTTTVRYQIFESVPVNEQGLDAALAVRLTSRYSAAGSKPPPRSRWPPG